MAFKRTQSGISNQNLFHDVDFVVFVEGGQNSFTKEEVEQNNYSEHSIDVLFWEKIFEKYKANVTLKFKAIGSKSTALKIAEDIAENDIDSAYVAMDKEFDDISGDLIESDHVLYTYGYSWENDFWNKALLKNLMEDLTAKSVEDALINKPYDSFLSDILLGVYADAYLFTKNDSFFPRGGHMKCVECNLKKEPHIKKSEIQRLLEEKKLNKSTLYSYGSRKSIDSKKHCFGHLLADFCWFIIAYLLKNEYSLRVVDKEVVNRLAMGRFIRFLSANVDNYYRQQFA